MSMKLNRRRLFSSVLLGLISLLAGCGTIGNSQSNGSTETDTEGGDTREDGLGTAHVLIYNLSDDPICVSASAMDMDDKETVLNRTVRIEADDYYAGVSEILFHSDYRVTVDVENGPAETVTWQDVSGPLHIIIPGEGDDVIDFAEQFG